MSRRRAISVYVLLAYALSWTVFILMALNHHHKITLFSTNATNWQLENIWHSAGALGPLIAAFVTLFVFHDKERRKHYLQGYSFRKLRGMHFLLALSPLLLFGICVLAGRIIEDRWLDLNGYFLQNQLNNPVNLLAWILPILFYGFAEEAGWRGYLLPQLQAKYNAFISTLILALFWVGWHLPTFFYRYDLKGGAYLGFTLGIFAGAICLTFLFNYTKGSILAVSLWHFSFNLVSMMVKDDPVLSAILSAMVMLIAGVILVRTDTENLSPSRRISFNGLPVSGNEIDRPALTIIKRSANKQLQH